MAHPTCTSNPDATRSRSDIASTAFSSRSDSCPATLRAALTTRIKIMAKLDIAERRLPHDGRIKTAVRGVEIDIRVSTLPTVFGESIVMRILDRTRVELDFTKLGLDDANPGKPASPDGASERNRSGHRARPAAERRRRFTPH